MELFNNVFKTAEGAHMYVLSKYGSKVADELSKMEEDTPLTYEEVNIKWKKATWFGENRGIEIIIEQAPKDTSTEETPPATKPGGGTSGGTDLEEEEDKPDFDFT